MCVLEFVKLSWAFQCLAGVIMVHHNLDLFGAFGVFRMWGFRNSGFSLPEYRAYGLGSVGRKLGSVSWQCWETDERSS